MPYKLHWGVRNELRTEPVRGDIMLQWLVCFMSSCTGPALENCVGASTRAISRLISLWFYVVYFTVSSVLRISILFQVLTFKTFRVCQQTSHHRHSAGTDCFHLCVVLCDDVDVSVPPRSCHPSQESYEEVHGEWRSKWFQFSKNLL